MNTAHTSDRLEKAQLRLVVAASASGTVFEWYDFFVFGLVAAAALCQPAA